jgi:hypothetical protein
VAIKAARVAATATAVVATRSAKAVSTNSPLLERAARLGPTKLTVLLTRS